MSCKSFHALAGLAAIAVTFNSVPPTASAEPYGFRGLVLGTPLSELRRLRFPEAPNARAVCTHDPEGAQLRPTVVFDAKPDEIEMGVISCGVFSFERRFGNSASSAIAAPNSTTCAQYGRTRIARSR